MENNNNIKVKIWSDIACPFCHIGKKNFEKALEQFPHRENVEIEWQSFQLDPDAEIEQHTSAVEKLAKKYGMSVEEAKGMNLRMTLMAKEAGINFNLDKLVLTNTFNAHRLIHLAGKYGLQNQAKERLFTAYLSEGKHIGDINTLISLGIEIGLKEDEIRTLLNGDQFKKEVKEEMAEARNLGINGVPFFVFDDKYAVSGAQPAEQLLKVLEDVWQKEHGLINLESPAGAICLPDGSCT